MRPVHHWARRQAPEGPPVSSRALRARLSSRSWHHALRMWSLPSTLPAHSTLQILGSTYAALGCPRCFSPDTPLPVWSKAAYGMPGTRITTVSWCGTAAPRRRCRSMTPAWTLSFPVWHGWPVRMRSSTPSEANRHSWRSSARPVQRYKHRKFWRNHEVRTLYDAIPSTGAEYLRRASVGSRLPDPVRLL